MTKERQQIVLQALLSRCSNEKRAQLERFLPEKLSQDPLLHFEPKGVFKDFWQQVHWSWLLPFLKTYSPKEQSYFLAALPPYMAENLQKTLQLAPSSVSLTRVASSYFRNLLEQSLISDLLPQEYLPSSSLNLLLEISKKSLIELIQLLALPDLAAELTQIVDTKVLKKIYTFLTEKECKRLKEVSSYKKSSSRLSLDRWNEEEESLRISLHRRGLARLAVALAHQHRDLAWYVSHQLDIGRGTALLKLSTKQTSQELSESTAQEINDLIRNYL